MIEIEIGKRIKECRLSAGLTLDELASKIGVNKSTVQRYENGKIAKIKLPVIQSIADALNVNPAWIIGKSDDKLNNRKYTSDFGLTPVRTRKIPLLGEIACGKPIFASEDRESYVSVGTDLKVDFCLTARGDSMIGARIMDGDIVFIQQCDIVHNGEIAAVIIDDEATLKRVYYYPEKSKLVLNAENPKYEPLVYLGEELNQIHILGRAVAFQSDVR